MIVALLFAATPRIAVACSCVPSSKPQFAENAQVVFTGHVTGFSQPIGLGPICTTSTETPVVVTFEVESVYKSELPQTTTVRTAMSGASCGYEFTGGKRYTVFATTGQNGLETNLCRGNVEGPIDPAEYGLGAAHPPKT